MVTNRVVFPSTAPENSSVIQELISSAQALEQEGHYSDAHVVYERAFSMLNQNDGLLASDLARWIARTHGSRGEIEAGLDCVELALAIAEAHSCHRATAQALNILGILYQSRGSLDEALTTYRRAETSAELAGDVQFAAMAQLNSGTIASIRGDFETALSNYETCLAGFRASGNEAFVSYVLNNLGLLYGDLGRREEAERALNEALDTAQKCAARPTQMMILINIADLLITSGRVDEAEQVCRDARDLLSSVGEEEMPAEWSKVMGGLERARGRFQEAERYLQGALKSARSREDKLLIAEVLREQAVLFSQQDRNQDTLRCLNRSYQLFLQLRALKNIADVERQLDELEQTFLSIVLRWGESIEAADRYTQGHCIRVADSACILARAAGMDDGTLLWFRMGALLHDVGKIIVPPEVLNKPGAFTPQERALMERHPDAGVELLEDIEFPWDIRPMVRFHHERWTGGGYPTGIAGDDIPLPARILAIADVFDALSTDRSYRKALPVEACLEVMCHTMSGHFDPRLLDTFVELCSSGQISPSGEKATTPSGQHAWRRKRVLIAETSPRAGTLEGIAASLDSEYDCTVAQPSTDLSTAASERAFVAAILVVSVSDLILDLRSACSQLRGQPLVAILEEENETMELELIAAGIQECLTHASLQPGVLARHIRRASERKRFQNAIEQASVRDDLTGLYNRRGFIALAEQRIRMHSTDSLRPVLVFADMDGLKPINDSLGHAVGDRALVEAASVFRSCFRGGDILGRLGGDEFVMLLFPGRHEIDRDNVLQRLKNGLAERNAAPHREFRLSVSVGFARLTAGESLGDLMARADRDMYRRKRERKPHTLSQFVASG